jgi:uncharacterized protein
MSKQDQKRWWQYGYVWLIIGGPLTVVIASFFTAYLAITRPDPAIEDYYRKGMEINKTLDAQQNAMAPAVEARNHAQTGIKKVK